MGSDAPAIETVVIAASADFSWTVVPIIMVSDLLPFNSRSFSRNHRCTAFEHSVIRLREVSVYGNEELGVICELMVADIERLDDASDWCYIGGEQRRPQSLVTRLRCKKMRQTIA